MIKRLKKSEAQDWPLIETMSSGFIMADKQGVLSFVNDRFCDMVGYHYDEIIGRPLSDFIDEAHKKKYQDQLAQRRRGEYHSYEITFSCKNGQQFAALISPKPLFGAEGIFTGSFKVVTDISELKLSEEKIRKERDFAESLLETAPTMILVLDTQGNIIRFNPYMEEISGYKLEELRGRNSLEVFLPESQHEKIKEKLLKALDGIQIKGYVASFFTKQGVERKIEWHNKTLKDREGNVIGLLAVGRDITQRLQAEIDLHESEEWQRSIFEGSRDAIFISGADARFVDVNEAAVSLTGYSKNKLKTMSIKDLHEEKDLGPFKTFFKRIMAGEAVTSQGIIRRQDGTKVDTEFSNSRIMVGGEPYMHTTARDITARTEAEKRLRSTLKEKEVLLQEIHHRVKNNMQVISSLLRLQAANIEGYDVEEMFQECQNRIRSMALIHDKLYKSKNFSQINFAEYIQSLTLHLLQTYNIKPNTIELKTELDDVLLDLNRAIPCGLIINEIVSNSLKHAFPGNEKGTIWVSLHVLKKEKLNIQVIDNGIGLPKNLDFRNPSTLGLQLVNDLVHQISGSIKIDGRKGTRVNISF